MGDLTPRRRVLLCATTTGYQTRMFDEAASRLGVDLVLATDRCDRLDDPWRDRAIPVRFHDEAPSVRAVLDALGPGPLDGVLAVGDRPVVLAALVAEARRLPWHTVAGARASRDKRLFRERQRAAGLPAPWTIMVPVGQRALPEGVSYPCVVKPLVLAGSRGVIRADDAASLTDAVERVSRLLALPDVRELRDEAAEVIQVEGYIDGDEFALEGVMDRGRLHVLAIFDKPDPLTGPYFEETLYVTPTARTRAHALAIIPAVTRAAHAAGLWHGPVHAECRVTTGGWSCSRSPHGPSGGRSRTTCGCCRPRITPAGAPAGSSSTGHRKPAKAFCRRSSRRACPASGRIRTHRASARSKTGWSFSTTSKPPTARRPCPTRSCWASRPASLPTSAFSLRRSSTASASTARTSTSCRTRTRRDWCRSRAGLRRARVCGCWRCNPIDTAGVWSR